MIAWNSLSRRLITTKCRFRRLPCRQAIASTSLQPHSRRLRRRSRGATKDKSNPAFKSKYADLSSVWDACRQALTENGVKRGSGRWGDGTQATIVTRLMHTSGQWIEGTLIVRPAKPTRRGIGSAITYARRYALAAMVGVCPEDDDGNAASDRNKTERSNNDREAEPHRLMIESMIRAASSMSIDEMRDAWSRGKTACEARGDTDGWSARRTQCPAFRTGICEGASMSALYELTDEWQQAVEALDAMPDLSPEVIADTLAGIESQWKDKAVAVATMIRNYEAAAEAKAAEAVRMSERAKAEQKRADGLRAYLLAQMQATGTKRIDAPGFAMVRRSNPGAVSIADASALLAAYWRVIPEKREPDKKSIGEALKRGEAVPGAEAGAVRALQVA